MQPIEAVGGAKAYHMQEANNHCVSHSRASRAPQRRPGRGGTIFRPQATKVALTSITYPGIPASVPAARRFVRGIFADSPRVDDLELIAAELISNALRHTPSGRDGGMVTITVRREPGRARLEVADQGHRPWRRPPRHGGVAEHGRGLAIVAALADDMGHGVIAGQIRVTWADVGW
jgi:anti-sigma regulatory factor (Ser/Thr protein kinase)